MHSSTLGLSLLWWMIIAILAGCGSSPPSPPWPDRPLPDLALTDAAGQDAPSDEGVDGQADGPTDLAPRCSTAQPCPRGLFCQDGGLCIPLCRSQDDCPADLWCDPLDHRCKVYGSCLADEECPRSDYCDMESQLCRTGCRLDPANCPEGAVCSAHDRLCTWPDPPPCIADEACPASAYCALGGDCLNGCRLDPDNCPPGTSCEASTHLCEDNGVPPSCAGDGFCPANSYCRLETGTCLIGCRLSPDNCSDGRYCDALTHECQDLPCAADGDCLANEYCESPYCLYGCRLSPDNCPPGSLCSPDTHQCWLESDPCFGVDCGLYQDCSPQSGRCLPAQSCLILGCQRDENCDTLTHECDPDGCLGRCGAYDACQDGQCVGGTCKSDAFFGLNGTPQSAALVDDGVYPGLTLCGWETDWYALDVDAGTSILIYLKFLQEDGDLDIRLFDSTFTGDINSFVSISASQTDDEIIAYNAIMGGRYTLMVQPSPAQAGAVYSLALRLRRSKACLVDSDCNPRAKEFCVKETLWCAPQDCREYWPCLSVESCNAATGHCDPLPCDEDMFGGKNISSSQAAYLEAGVVEGLTICHSEEDWFVLEGEGGHCLRVETRGLGQGVEHDLALMVLGGTVGEQDVIALSDIPGDETVEANLQESGVYWIRAFGATQAEYSLSVEFQDEYCSLECVPACGGLEVCDHVVGRCEPAPCEADRFGGINKDAAHGANIGAGTYEGLTICQGEEDWFSLVSPGGWGCLMVQATFVDGGDETDIDLDLFDPSGELVRQGIAPGGSQERLAYTMVFPGTYQLRVYRAQRNIYDLGVEILTECPPLPCTYTWQCEAGEVCGPDRVCEAVDCRRGTLICGPKEVCNEDTGLCDHVLCPWSEDAFGNDNHSCPLAADMVPGVYTDLRLCASDSDWYTLRPGEGQTLTVRATPDLEARLTMVLYGPPCESPLWLGATMGAPGQALEMVVPVDGYGNLLLWVGAEEDCTYDLGVSVE